MNLIWCILIAFYSLNNENILIGDSQTFQLKKNTTIVKQIPELSKTGVGVKGLIKLIEKYPISEETKTVTICIGVNDGYIDEGISELIYLVRLKFPNAKIYVIKGSWGWGNVSKLNVDKFNNYYKKFEDLGAQIIQTPIGHGDPHKNKKVYKTIMSELEWKITQEQQE
jgi:hypothetical protein